MDDSCNSCCCCVFDVFTCGFLLLIRSSPPSPVCLYVLPPGCPAKSLCVCSHHYADVPFLLSAFVLPLGCPSKSLVFKEMVSVRYSAAKERDMPLFRTLQWSWFFVAMFYTYGDFLHEFVQQHRALLWLSPITKWNAWFSFLAYCCVFVVSVLTLKKGLYKYQACFGTGEGVQAGGGITWSRMVATCLLSCRIPDVKE